MQNLTFTAEEWVRYYEIDEEMLCNVMAGEDAEYRISVAKLIIYETGREILYQMEQRGDPDLAVHLARDD